MAIAISRTIREEFADGGEDLGVLACVGTGGAGCGRFAVIEVRGVGRCVGEDFVQDFEYGRNVEAENGRVENLARNTMAR